MKNIGKKVMLAAAALMMTGMGAIVPMGEANAQQASQTAKKSPIELPAGLRRAAIKASGATSGEIAGSRIPGTVHYVVYVKTPGNCGSGGCRAQLWTIEDKRYTQKASLPVGYLSISVLPWKDNGMPMLGIEVVDDNNQNKVLALGFDGENYLNADWDNLIPTGTGQAIVTRQMLSKF